MPKRLFDGLDQGLGEQILLLDDLPLPDQREIYCGLCRALEQALALMGRETTYAGLMGLTGAAFLVPMGEALGADWAGANADRHLFDALRGLGVVARREEHPTEATVLDLCRGELGAGRPLLGLWQGDWATIVGLKGQEWLGRFPGSSQPFEPQPPTLESLMALSLDGEPPPTERAHLQALERALSLLEESAQQWDQWREKLDVAEPYGPEPGRLEHFMAEQYLSACVLDARDAAAQFLSAMPAPAAGETAEALLHAAHVAEELVSLLEQLLVAPEVISVAHLPEDMAWVERRRECLGRARAGDERLARAIAEAVDIAGEEA